MTEYNSAGAHLSGMGSHMRYYYVCSKARKSDFGYATWSGFEAMFQICPITTNDLWKETKE